jgi:hypothetical protein
MLKGPDVEPFLLSSAFLCFPLRRGGRAVRAAATLPGQAFCATEYLGAPHAREGDMSSKVGAHQDEAKSRDNNPETSFV